MRVNIMFTNLPAITVNNNNLLLSYILFIDGY